MVMLNSVTPTLTAALLDSLGVVLKATAQTISGVKTFTALPITAVVPTAGNQFTNKTYVDTAIAAAGGGIMTLIETTDDLEAIIEAGAAGDSFWLEAGTHTVTGATTMPAVDMSVYGSRESVVSFTGAHDAFETAFDRNTFIGFTIAGSGAANGSGIDSTGDELRVMDMWFDWNGAGATANAAVRSSGANCHIFENDIDGQWGNGIHILTGVQQMVNENWVHGVTGHGILSTTVAQAQILDNLITDGVTASRHAIMVEAGSYIIVGRNIIEDWDAAATMVGIYWTDATFGQISKNIIRSTSGQGIVLEDDSGTDPDDVIVEGNIIDAPTSHGIEVNDGDRVQILGNHISNGVTAVTDGIHMVNTDMAICSGNTIYDWDAADPMVGILWVDGIGGIITGNYTFSTSGNGINVKRTAEDPDDVIVSNNIIDTPKTDGISCANANRIQLHGNKIMNGIFVFGGVRAIIIDSCDYVTIQDNTISNWDDDAGFIGIWVLTSVFGIISNNLIRQTGSTGILLSLGDADFMISGNVIDTPGGTAIQCEDVDRVQILGNHITNGVTATTYGIHAINCDYGTVQQNTIDNWDANANMAGILWTDGVFGSIQGNLIHLTSLHGIWLDDAGATDPDDMVVSGNIIDAPGGDGIRCEDADRVQVNGNHVTNGATNGRHAINVLVSVNGVISGNMIENWDVGASMSGIVVNGGSACVISSNDITNVGALGINVVTNPSTIVNGNYIFTCGNVGIRPISSEDSIISNNIIDTPSDNGIKCDTSDRCQVIGNTVLNGVTTLTEAIEIDTCNYATVRNNLVNNWDAAATMVGIFVDSSTFVAVSDNLIHLTSGHGIHLDDVSGTDPDDCVVSGNLIDAPSGHGILCEDADRVQLIGNHVTNGVTTITHAVEANNCVCAIISGNIIWNWDAVASMRGINVLNATCVDVIGNVIWDTSDRPIFCSTGNFAVVSGNLIRNSSSVTSIAISGITSSVVTGNFIELGNTGIQILNATQGSTVTGNFIYNNGFYGVDIDTSPHTVVDGNCLFSTASYSVYIHGSQFVTVSNNTIDECANHSIFAETDGTDPDDLLIQGNMIEAPDDDGIRVENGDRCQVFGNHITNGVTASTYGIYMLNCDLGMVKGNLIDNWDAAATMDGIHWTDGVGGLIEGNTINLTSGSSIVLEDDSATDPDDMTVRGNVCVSFGDDAIRCVDADDVAISGNTIRANTANGAHGISCDNCDWAIVSGNKIRDVDFDATADGINFANGTVGLIDGNHIRNPGRAPIRLEDTQTQSDVVNNRIDGDAVVLGAGAGNQDDWGSGHSFNQ